jgi:hypothetical protein
MILPQKVADPVGMNVRCLQDPREVNELGVTRFGISRTSALLLNYDNVYG